ncbi:MAG: universal stress protein [Pseudomonadota bacterium]|nr:universal stress protein [Pseudomonadota bacterium]
MTAAPKPRPVVIVPLDGSVEARAALPVARALAKMEGATLHVLHVSESRLAPPDADQRLRVSGEGDSLVVDTFGGDPAAAILAASTRWGASILVLSSHCGHPRPRSGLGSVAEAVLLAAGVPVVFVHPSRGEAEWAPRLLLLPLDGTPTSAQAVTHGARLARESGARLSLLHVAGPGSCHTCEAGTIRPPIYADQPQHEWPAWRDEFLARSVCHDDVPDGLSMNVAHGSPGAETVRVAATDHADLIVMGWHGVLDEHHGATLRTVLSEATCPVMVIRV